MTTHTNKCNCPDRLEARKPDTSFGHIFEAPCHNVLDPEGIACDGFLIFGANSVDAACGKCGARCGRHVAFMKSHAWEEARGSLGDTLKPDSSPPQAEETGRAEPWRYQHFFDYLSMSGIESNVCADIAARQQMGIKKYGTTVADNPLLLHQWLQHAYEECLDQAVYLKRAISELERTKV